MSGRAASGGARFERSALARVAVGGSERRDFLQRLVSNDVSRLESGRGAPTLLLERTGRVVDRVIVADRGDDFLLVGSAGRAPAVVAWLARYVIADDVTVEDVGPRTRLVTVVGPRGAEAICRGLGVAVAELGPWEHRRGAAGGEPVLVLRAEDVGGGSFHVIGSPAATAAASAAVAELPAADDAAWDALRVAAGVPAFGAEFDERTIPLETRMADAISFTKGCYVGQEVIARLHNQDRVKRALVRMRIEAARPPAPGAAVLVGDEEVGTVTSSARGPDGPIALGYVKAGLEAPGTRLVAGAAPAEVLPLTPAGDPAWA
jgi:folate-binding protein YgfZ